MSRNATLPLSDSQRATSLTVARTLAPYVGTDTMVSVSFIKRDGSPRTVVGPVVGIIGDAMTTTGAVTIDTAEGPRSANLYRVVGVSV